MPRPSSAARDRTPPRSAGAHADAADTVHASQASPLLRWSGPVGSIVLALAAIIAFTGLGYGSTLIAENGRGRLWVSGAAAVFSTMPAMALAAGYLLAAVGLGRVPMKILQRWCSGRGERSALGGDETARGHRRDAWWGGGVWVQVGLGVALMLFCSHALGMAGGLREGVVGQIVAWGVVGIGLLLLIDQVVRGELRPESWPVAPVWIVLAAPALGLMIVAAASPPGWLWDTEARGFDALSYHLQLPKEWSANGRLWPLEHNVYSFLPSYVEAAYLHVAAMLGGGERMIAGEGLGVIAAQMLHVQMGLLSAVLIGRAVFVALERVAMAGVWANRCGVLAGALFLCTPWVIVTATLAYNEMAVTLLTAAALVLCVDGRVAPAVRWIGAGLLMGAAASAKPTAIFLAAPTIGMLLLMETPPRQWMRLGVLGAATGVAVLLPWLVRNWIAAGNPVFPFAAGLFGSGHWGSEQVARYSAAHAVDGGASARFALLLDGRRGVLHAQWALFFPVTVAALAAGLVRPATRRLAAAVGAGSLVQVAGWMFLTHEQSRFLLPLAPALAVAFGLGAGALVSWVMRHGAGRGVAALAALVIASAPLSQMAWSAMIFTRQSPDARGAGQPNMGLLLGASAFTGEGLADSVKHLHERERLDAAREHAPNGIVFANAALGEGDRVYLLGDATPLYVAADALYHTTWDPSPLGEAVRAHPDDPAAWSRELRGRGVTHVLVNYDELARYTLKDGWYDPDVTIPLVNDWLARWGEPVAAWPTADGGGSAMYRLRNAPSAQPAAEGRP